MTSFPMQEIAGDVLRDRYLRPGEASVDDVYDRVAKALAVCERPDKRAFYHEHFRRALADGFIPGGRICASAGCAHESTLLNCFVQPIGDSMDGKSELSPGIYTALSEATETMRRGGGVGYNFSALPPRGAAACAGDCEGGPLKYMGLFEKSCTALETDVVRPWAQMAVLNVDHPDIFEFIDAKRERARFTTFNLSVGVSDAFMHVLAADGDFELVHQARPQPDTIGNGAFQHQDGLWVYRVVPARQLWQRLMQAAYDCGEPGVLFLDRINRENNLAYCENIEATNPCGEQPLPAYGSCCLGSLNLTRFVEHPFTSNAQLNIQKMIAVIDPAVRMLDNVIDTTPWPLKVQRDAGLSTRRIGLGITGLADALVMLGHRYDSPEARNIATSIGKVLRDTAYRQSIALAVERGPFPLFRMERYLRSAFVLRLPTPLRQQIQKHGIRNSHLLAIAPAGSISIAFADNTSSGVEPAFAWNYYRNKRLSDGTSRRFLVEDYAHRYFRKQVDATGELPPQFVDAWQIDPYGHLNMVVELSPYIDAAISKTINVAAEYPFDRFRDLYLEAWRRGLKGVAVFRPNAVTGVAIFSDRCARAGAGDVADE